SLSDLIIRAVRFSNAQKGASLAHIKKALISNGYDVVRKGDRFREALRTLINKGVLQRVTGRGIAGSFRIGRLGKKQLEGTRGRRKEAGGASEFTARRKREPRRGGNIPAKRSKRKRARENVAASTESEA
ncbi:PREDICTED: histone H1.11R-like, partial [Mesitornis unicolor]|uniref:histone H1.11R-like n=1 Tax=Mesitornis unicolor TaxID=54374 RepID=UPI000528A5F2